MDRQVKPGDDGGMCGAKLRPRTIPALIHFRPLKSLANKKLIPALETAPILVAPRSIEGVVDRDA